MYLNLDSKISLNPDVAESPNLCDRFSSLDLDRIGACVWSGYDTDEQSRSQWKRRMNSAMDLAMQVQETKTFPWPGAANVIFPLVTIAALQFSARAYPSLIQGNNVFRYRVIGPETTEVRDRALRVGKHMSWQVLEQDEAWEEQHDRLLINLSIVGCSFIKSWHNSHLGYPVSELVMANELAVNYWAKNMNSAPRATHIIPKSRNDIYEQMMNGTYRDCRDEAWFKDPSRPQTDQKADQRQGVIPGQSDFATPFKMLEQICLLDLDKDGYEEPYTITIDSISKKVTRISARWNDSSDVETRGYFRKEIIKIKAEQPYTKYSFIPSPDGSMYDLGFGTFLGPINEAVNTGINQLLDSGTMQNSIGGFLGRGAKIRGGTYTMAPWEWKRVDSTGDDLRKNIVPFPDREPSNVTFSLIGLLIEYANRLAGTTDAQVGENPGQNTPAQTYQGMVEQGAQMSSMIFLRIWRCLKEEAKQRYALNATFLKQHENFGSNKDFIRREDYLGSPDQIAPVANKKMTSTVMQLQKVLAVKQDSLTTQGYDLVELTKEFLEALEIEGIERIFPGPGKVPPLPNPKVAMEQAKQQGKDKDRQAKMQEKLMELQANQKKEAAEIQLLWAQTLKTVKEAGQIDAAAALEKFETVMQMHIQHGQMITERIQAMQGLMGDKDDSQNSNGGGTPGASPSPSNAGPSANAGANGGGNP